RAKSPPPVLGTAAPRWLVIVALVCWATLSGPAHAQLLVESALPGFDSRSSVVASDRSPSLQTTDRRHHASADGDPTPLATDSVTPTSTGLSGTQPLGLSPDAYSAYQPRSPAQPRA